MNLKPSAHSILRISIRVRVLVAIVLAWAALPATAQKPAEPDWRTLAAERAQILSRVKWTPVTGTMPNRKGGFFEQDKELTGVPYSSVRAEGRSIGFDISLRTFLAAVENPLSVLYTENLAGRVPNAAAYYGTVCSSYTSYALQCAIQEVSRRHGPAVSKGVVKVEPHSAQGAEVGDVIYTPHATESSGSHVELVTEVVKDAGGRVVSVLVEESRPPTTATTRRTAATFNAHLAAKKKQLYRVTDLDDWRGVNRVERALFPDYAADAKKADINRTLLLDLGDWVPYEKGRPVKFNLMDRDALGMTSLVVQKEGKVVELLPINGRGVIERVFQATGDYTAHVLLPDGSTSAACEFAVCDLVLGIPDKSVQLGKEWKLSFSAANMRPLAVYLSSKSDSYGRHPLFLTDEDRQLGEFTVPAGLLKKPGVVNVWLIGEHRLGRLKVQKDIRVIAPE